MKITNENFQAKVIESDKPFLLHFTGNFCGPSKITADLLSIDDPVLDSFQIGDVDVWESPSLGQKLEIKGTPTLMVFHNGKLLANNIGTMKEEEFFEWLESCLKLCSK